MASLVHGRQNDHEGAAPARRHPPRTRISAAWTGAAVAVVVGICLIDFIVQNTRSVRIEFFAASGNVPVAVALLASAVAGGLVVLAIGLARTAQLRLHARRQQRVIDAAPAATPPTRDAGSHAPDGDAATGSG